jgi:hypothetical protein
MQPISEVIDVDKSKPSMFFNVGQFTLPVLYGSLVGDMEFMTEFKMQESYPHIENAFLHVGILVLKPDEPIPDHPFSFMKIQSKRPSSLVVSFGSEDDINRRFSTWINDPLNWASVSVFATFFKTYLSTSQTFEVHPDLSSKVFSKFARCLCLEGDERVKAVVAIQHFIKKLFEAKSEIDETVQSRYLLPYSPDMGAMVALDLLHKMPIRKDLISAAQEAGSVAAMRTGLSRAWDNKISYHKTIFRYLPGALNPQGSSSLLYDSQVPEKSLMSRATMMNFGMTENNTSSGKDPSMIVDDASVNVNFSSTETTPEFIDNFSSTAGLALGPNACLLVVVTAVDVLTSKRKVSQAPPKLTKANSVASMSTHYVFNSNDKLMGNLSRASSIAGFVMSPDDSHSEINHGAAAEDHSHRSNYTTHSLASRIRDRLKPRGEKKSNGVRGIHIGHGDPKSTFWGIVPLFSKFPKVDVQSTPIRNIGTDGGSHRSLELPRIGARIHTTLDNNSSRQKQQEHNARFRRLSRELSETIPQMFRQSRGSPTAASFMQQPGTRPTTPPHAQSSMKTSHLLPTAGVPADATSSHIFVNDGLFQIPLFQGLPPMEMVESADPFAWLISRLAQQISDRSKLIGCSRFFWSSCLLTNGNRFQNWLRAPLAPLAACIGIASPKYAAISPDDSLSGGSNKKQISGEISDKSVSVANAGLSTNSNNNNNYKKPLNKNKKKKKSSNKVEEIILSNGSSAFVRLVDPRLKRLLSKRFSTLPSSSDSVPNSHHHRLHNSYNPETDSYHYYENVVNDIVYMMSHVAYCEVESAIDLNPVQPSSREVGKLSPTPSGSIEDDKGVETSHVSTLQEKAKVYQNSGTISPVHENIRVKFDKNKFKELQRKFHLDVSQCKEGSYKMPLKPTAELDQSILSKCFHVPEIFGTRSSYQRNFYDAIPDNIDEEMLIQEINNKFYHVLSS